MEITINMLFFTTTGELAKILEIHGDELVIEFRGNLYRRNVSIIGDKLFPVGDNLLCKNCRRNRREECFGSNEICDMFQFTGVITQEEMDNWPKFGDATYFRFGGNIDR